MLTTLRFVGKMLPGALAAAAVYGAALPVRRRRLARLGLSAPKGREGAMLLFALFVGGMAAITLTPRSLCWGALLCGAWEGPFFARGTVNLRPFATFGDLYILLGNIVMFLPFGFFPALLFRGFDRRRALLTGLCITGFIEVTQLFVGRTFDIDDLMLNTLGVLLGFCLQRALGCTLHCRAAGK